MTDHDDLPHLSYVATLLLQLFHGPLSGLPGWAGSRRNIHSLIPILIINHPLSASSHLLPFIASSLFNLHAWRAFCTTSL